MLLRAIDLVADFVNQEVDESIGEILICDGFEPPTMDCVDLEVAAKVLSILMSNDQILAEVRRVLSARSSYYLGRSKQQIKRNSRKI